MPFAGAHAFKHFHRRPDKYPSLPSRHPTRLVGVTLAISQGIRELLQGAPDELGLLPQVGCKEAVGVGDSSESSLEGVLEGLGGAGRRGVGILNTSELEETLDGGGSDDVGTAGSRDKLWKMRISISSERKFWGSCQIDQELTRTVTEPHLPLSLVGRE